jgi:hypothetical protein
MSRPSSEDIVKVLLDYNPVSIAHILGIDIEDATASSLFRLACAAVLFNEQVVPEMVLRAMRVFAEKNWTSPENMLKATDSERETALETADYVMFDERIPGAQLLSRLSQEITDRYQGDLRNLRKMAREDPGIEKELLKELPGMGELQTGIFLREVQVAWCENFPFMSRDARSGARMLGLPEDGSQLARMSGSLNFPRLAAALERVHADGNYRDVLEKAERVQHHLV